VLSPVTTGQIVILNGTPRSGKTSIARALVEQAPGDWINVGVDGVIERLPRHLRPGIGLRPGAERPDLEDAVVALYLELYASVAADAAAGVNVVVDVGHHDHYSRPLRILPQCARRLSGLPVLFVGVRCPVEVIWQRREQTWRQPRRSARPELVAAVDLWQHAVHAGLAYDLEVRTDRWSPERCAEAIATRLASGPPGSAFASLALAPR
jgi:chloramphenicol 3-O phosphotransferase